MSAIAGYKTQFDAVFPGEGVTPTTIVKALSAYERTLACDDTAYDKYAKGDVKALSDEQKKGLDLFMGKAACITCHTPPHFSTAYGGPQGTYYNVGIGTKVKKEEEVDVGRAKVSTLPADWAAFKVPTLRNVARTFPYFHDGSKKTLREAVDAMAVYQVGGPLAEKDAQDLVKFLETLTGEYQGKAL